MLPLKNFLGVVEKEDSAVVGIILIRLNRVEGYQKTFTMNNYNYLLWYDGLDLLLVGALLGVRHDAVKGELGRQVLLQNCLNR